MTVKQAVFGFGRFLKNVLAWTGFLFLTWAFGILTELPPQVRELGAPGVGLALVMCGVIAVLGNAIINKIFTKKGGDEDAVRQEQGPVAPAKTG